MLIEHTQAIISQILNNLKQRIGFMEVFKQLGNTPQTAFDINKDLVNSVGTYFTENTEYKTETGSDIAQIIFEYLEKHPNFKAMFKTVKSHIMEQMAAQSADIINNILKDKGPTV